MKDYRRNNKIILRNFNKKVDFHDLVKTLFVRMLRREHPDINQCQIYTEHNLESPNDNYPDIYMAIRKTQKHTIPDIYVYELQEEWNEKWLKKQKLKFEDVSLFIPINLKEVRDEFDRMRIKQPEADILDLLRKALEKYIV